MPEDTKETKETRTEDPYKIVAGLVDQRIRDLGLSVYFSPEELDMQRRNLITFRDALLSDPRDVASIAAAFNEKIKIDLDQIVLDQLENHFGVDKETRQNNLSALKTVHGAIAREEQNDVIQETMSMRRQ